MKKILFFLVLGISFCVFSENIGYWHVELILNKENTLPTTALYKNHKIFILNADESIELDKIRHKNDSVFVAFKAFNSEIKARIITPTKIEGAWYNYAKDANYTIPITCSYGKKPRFNSSESTIDITGKWEVTFSYNEHPEKALGIFNLMDTIHSSSTTIKGTFLTETGDYRYLQGVVSSDSLLLSTFDGSHAFLFKSKLVNDTLWGEFMSGTHYSSKWFAVRNDKFKLNNPDSLTYLVNAKPIQFKLKDSDNNWYNYPNAETIDKVTLIQIAGTWCPNCLDESNYLKTVKEKYNDQIKIIAVAFEHEKTAEARIEKINRYKQNLALNYTFLLGGKASKQEAANLFPMLNAIISFPTLIFIDKQGKIRKIHTGFNGPGTGDYYTDFLTKTNAFIETLLTENN